MIKDHDEQLEWSVKPCSALGDPRPKLHGFR